MKILYVTPSFASSGGTDAWLVEVAARLARRHDVHLWTGNSTPNFTTNIKVRPVASLRRPYPALFRYLSFVRQAQARWVRERPRFDVVHASGGDAAFADVVTSNFCQAERLDLARRGEIRVEAHDDRRATLDRLSQHVYMRAVTRVERRMYRSPTLRKVIAVSHGLGSDLVRQYALDPRQIVVLPNGVTVMADRPDSRIETRSRVRRQLGISESAFVAAFVGGDWGRKGLTLAIRGIALSATRTHLLVAGRGERRKYERLAISLGVRERVHFLGHVPPQEYLLASDAFLMPTAYEGFSVALLEAAAARLPLLSSRCNGASELVSNGVTGFLVERDPADIADKLQQLAVDLPAARTMGAAAAAAVRRGHDWDAIAERTEEVYASLDAGARMSLVPTGDF